MMLSTTVPMFVKSSSVIISYDVFYYSSLVFPPLARFTIALVTAMAVSLEISPS